jgi:hypothetical protein
MGGSDVLVKPQCLTASQGSENEEEGCRVCEMDLKENLSQKKRAIDADCKRSAP